MITWRWFTNLLSAFRRGNDSRKSKRDYPLERAIRTGRHLLVRGQNIQAEIAHVEMLVSEWRGRRDAWHGRMEEAGIDVGRFVVTLNGQPLKKGVYAFRDGPYSRTPGVRRIHGADLGSDMRSGILAVGLLDEAHFAIAAQARWTLIGCAGGGSPEIDEILVDGYQDVTEARQQNLE